MAVFDGGNEGGIERAEGCSVKVLGKFALGDVMEGNAVCLVRMGTLLWLLGVGAGFQWDVPQAIGVVAQAGDYYLVVFQDFYIKFGEDGNAVIIAELPHGYE